MTDRFARPTGPAWGEPAEQPADLYADAELAALERLVAAGERVVEAYQQADAAFDLWLNLLRERLKRQTDERRPGGTADDG